LGFLHPNRLRRSQLPVGRISVLLIQIKAPQHKNNHIGRFNPPTLPE
jgi:hypothetical protein